MRASLLLTILLLAGTLDAHAGQGLTWTKRGADGAGLSAYERFELKPDGQARWETSGRGADCPSEGGTYETHLSTAELGEAVKLASALVAEQSKKGAASAAASSRDVRQRLAVERDGKVVSAELVAATETFYALLEKLAALKARMRPVSAVRMKLSRVGKTLRVRFEQSGPEPFTLLLPEKASEAFSAKGGAPLSYVAPPEERETRLTRESPSAAVELKTIPLEIKKGELWYSNATVRHHASGDLILDPSDPVDLSLCVRFP